MQIPEIKSKLPIIRVLRYYNLQPDKHQMLHCTFHADKSPSLKIYEKTNTFHCFGCGATGDQIEFIQKKENLNKHQAILKAKSMAENPISKLSIPVQTGHALSQQSQNTLSQQLPNTLPEQSILTKLFKSFQNGLARAEKPRKYLKQRHLNLFSGVETDSKLEIGFNSGQFHHHGKLSEKEMKACIDAGLLIPYTGKTPHAKGQSYTAFAKDCIIFPLKNKNGEIVSFYGRSILNNTKSKHYYLKNRSGLYPEYPKAETEILILTESIIDAATLLQYIGSKDGRSSVTTSTAVLSLYGTNGLTKEHIQAIAELQNLKETIFFFDGDKAGRAAVVQTGHALSQQSQNALSQQLSTVETPENEDINSLLDGHEPDIFEHLLKNRKPFDSAQGKPYDSAQGKLFSFSTEEKITEKPEETAETAKLKKIVQQNKAIFNSSNADYITFTSGDLQMAVLGGINMQQLDRLRVTLKINIVKTGHSLSESIRNNIDLYSVDQTDRFINKAAEKLESGTSGLNRAISELTDKLEQYRLSKMEAQKVRKSQKRELTPERKKRAIDYLKQKNLLEQTNRDIGRTGLVGEETNRMLMYLIFTSRLRKQPLHIISLGGSGTGKTYLQEKISELIPEHDKKEITILSENAFYYFEKTELKNKLVLIEDMDGAEAVLYPLRELQSKKKISKTVPLKDSKGNLKTITLHVEGPICLAGTTTREQLYEDNANRSILIYLDSSKQQNEHIMNYQRRLSAGKIKSEKEEEIKEFFKDMQSVLKPIKVVNPYAEMLKIPDYVFKPLRTNSHYLAFIETITFYHQYQRPLKTNRETGEKYIETTFEDIENANWLIKDVLLAKSDELPKAIRDFFEQLKKLIKKQEKESFYTKEIREKLRMYPMKINRYLRELESRSFIRKIGGNRKNGYEYEIYKKDEYQKLKSGMNVLDDILNEIREVQEYTNKDKKESITV